MTEARYLLDSNICIYILGDFNGSAAQRLAEQPQGWVVTSAIVEAEVERGLVGANVEERMAADALFDAVAVLPFDSKAAAAYAGLPFRRARFDRLIAAHALATGLTLVTGDMKGFADIPGLSIENWAQ